jgi:hypothetical protein
MAEETKKIKFTRGVQYKDLELFKAGATAEVDSDVADRIIADGNAEEVESKKAKSDEKPAEK